MPPDEVDPDQSQPVEMPIDGTLDLHMFSPKEVKNLVHDYIDACLQRKILNLRIVHGKGIGALRRTVHSILDRHPAVAWYGHQSEAGAWGATVVTLQPPVEEQPQPGANGPHPTRRPSQNEES